jgi:CheY-like chemotaxis protein
MAEASHPPKQRTVLVVDDVSVDRKILSKCLERDGYSVSLAYDGRQALQLLRAQQGSIDLVRTWVVCAWFWDVPRMAP